MSSNTLTNHRATLELLPAVERRLLNPTTVEFPSFLLNAPFAYTTEIPNNAWMQDLSDDDRRVNEKTAMRQFLELYQFMASRSLVHLLPTPRNSTLQDLVFTANLGIVLEHLEERTHVVLANFSSPPRMGETEVGRDFFKAMGYDVHIPPHKFEGEAELKHLHGNVYVGGYGERSRKEAYEWMEQKFGMRVVKLHQRDPYFYHLDCTIFPLTRGKTLVCTEMFTKPEIAELERHTEIIPVTRAHCLAGICNSVRISNTILNQSNVHELEPGCEKHRLEVIKNRELVDIAADNGFEVGLFNLSEFLKGGAVLSCMVMHMNRTSYNYSLI